jgi:hypothetical protein
VRRLAAFVAITCATVLAAAAARAETLDDLKAKLAAKKADVAKLERRIHQMGGQAPAKGVPPIFVAPVAGPTARPPTTAVAAAPPSDDQELERALERTLVREGALVLPTWGFQATPQFSYTHWDKIQDPFISNTYSGAIGRHGLALAVTNQRFSSLCFRSRQRWKSIIVRIRRCRFPAFQRIARRKRPRP